MIDAAVGEIADQLTVSHVPGMELVVVRGDEVVVAGGVGVRGVEDAAPVGSRTLFQHGSCGKAYTGLLGALLAEAGTVDLDVPVRRYVPELRLADAYVADHVTLRDLLSHRSGFGRHDLIWILDQALDRAELVRRLEFVPLAHEPRTTWSYSNLAFTLAGFAMGRATDSTWEEQLRLHVLEPLGMTRTFTSYDAIPSDDTARPHLLQDGKPVQGVVRRADAAAPAGQVVTCADDTTRWLMLQAGQPLLPQSAVKTTQTIAALLPPNAMPFPEIDITGYGLGWGIGTYRGRPARWHSGGIDGYSTQTIVLPEQGIGILASANLNSTDLPLATILRLADAMLDEAAETSWFDRVRGTASEDTEPVDKPPAPAEVKAPAPAAHPLEDYAGTYTHPAYGDLVVTVTDGELSLRIAATDLPAKHRHYETWDLRYEPLDVPTTVTFGADPDGKVVEAVAPLDADTEPIRFRRAAG